MKSALDQVVLSECWQILKLICKIVPNSPSMLVGSWQILKLICQNSSKLTFNVRKVKVSPVSISSDKDT